MILKINIEMKLNISMKYSCKCKKKFTIIYPKYESLSLEVRGLYLLLGGKSKMRPIISLIHKMKKK